MYSFDFVLFTEWTRFGTLSLSIPVLFSGKTDRHLKKRLEVIRTFGEPYYGPCSIHVRRKNNDEGNNIILKTPVSSWVRY